MSSIYYCEGKCCIVLSFSIISENLPCINFLLKQSNCWFIVIINATGIAAFIEREVPGIHLYEGTQEGLWTFSCCRKARMAFHQGHGESRDNIGRLCAALTLQDRNPTPSDTPQIRTGSVCIYTVGLNYKTLSSCHFRKRPFKKRQQAVHVLDSRSWPFHWTNTDINTSICLCMKVKFDTEIASCIWSWPPSTFDLISIVFTT